MDKTISDWETKIKENENRPPLTQKTLQDAGEGEREVEQQA